MDKSRSVLVGLFALALTAAPGCKKSGASNAEGETSGAAAAVTITPEARAEAEGIFSQRCTPCHGSTGGGDGPASGGLTPRPRNFHDRAWQGQVSDEHIEQIIQYGGAAVNLSAAMPANPDLQERPAVVAALREHVRSLRQ